MVFRIYTSIDNIWKADAYFQKKCVLYIIVSQEYNLFFLPYMCVFPCVLEEKVIYTFNI